jgi:hypothetical protein
MSIFETIGFAVVILGTLMFIAATAIVALFAPLIVSVIKQTGLSSSVNGFIAIVVTLTNVALALLPFYYTVPPEAAAAIGVDDETLRRWLIQAGHQPPKGAKRRWRVRTTVIDPSTWCQRASTSWWAITEITVPTAATGALCPTRIWSVVPPASG